MQLFDHDMISCFSFYASDGMTHWHEPESATTSSHHYWSPPHQQSKPIDIEMTSYALLVFAINSQFTEGLPVMKWITKQRNPNGGFASTQVGSLEWLKGV